MNKPFAFCLLLLVGSMTPAAAHDMFLIAEDHHVPAEAAIEIALYNGTFDESLNVIDRERMVDVTVVDGGGTVTHPGIEAWRDEGDTSLLGIRTGPAGALVVGVSTRPRVIELSAEEFNGYLQHDGILDTLAEREARGTLDQSARERYAKHVKLLLEVDGRSSDSWTHRLGYPIEFVPLADPNRLGTGDELEALLLLHGEPVADHLVYASHTGFHAHDDDGAHREAVSTRTDGEGIARIPLSTPGRWYLRAIHMAPSDDAEVDYVSSWATMTFEID